ncbi:MAG TPA: POTRA domain-containing protein, partial [Planctomycetota bacterium]|nr:POTRA domain-containing protein [Planctomycetota bacterium]
MADPVGVRRSMVGVALGRVKASESQAPRSPSSASQARLRARFATGSTFTSRRCALLTRRVDVLFVSFLLIVLASFEGGACGRGGGRLVAQDLPESRVEELAPLTSIEFTGRDWISTETLLGRSGLALDEPVTRARIDEAVARLRNDEWLEQVGDPEVTSAPDGTRVAIPVTPRRVVRDLEIESDVREIETAVREKLLLRPGRPFVEASLDEDRDRLLDWLHDEGYLFAGVEASVEELPQGGVALTWTVRSGARVRLGSVTFRGNESFSDRE